MKQKSFLLSFFLFFFLSTPFLNLFSWDSDAGLDYFADEFKDVEHLSLGQTRLTAVESLATLLVEGDRVIDGAALVADPLYNFTKPIRRRTPLDMDFIQFPNYVFHKNLTIFPFFNQISKAVLPGGTKTALSTYIDMDQTRIIKALDDAKFTEFDIPTTRLIQLFKNIKIQERRIGFMFQYNTKVKDWDISFATPLLYQENNFYLTRSEIKRIEQEPFFQNIDTDIIKFAQEHLISDKFGVGDLRISFEKIVKETFKQHLSFGFDLTIPTAFAFARGIIGNHFDKKKTAPSFNLYDDVLALYQPGMTPAAAQPIIDKVEKFSIESLDRVSTILLENPLGNNHHVGLAFFTRNKLNFTPTTALTTKAKCELLLPSLERRFFKIRPNIAELNALEDVYAEDMETAEAVEQLNKFNTFLLQKIFPESYKTVVFPGCSFHVTNELSHEMRRWILLLGSDWWYHTKETFGSITASNSVLDNLDLEAGRLGSAFQSRLWIGLDKIQKEGSAFNWGMRLSLTGFNYGIGSDFALAFKLSYDF